MNYSKALAVTRAAKSLQQKDIAKLLDVTPSYVSRIEKGERPMSDAMVDILSSKLKIPKELFMLLGQDSEIIDKEDSKTIDDLSKELLRIVIGS